MSFNSRFISKFWRFSYWMTSAIGKVAHWNKTCDEPTKNLSYFRVVSEHANVRACQVIKLVGAGRLTAIIGFSWESRYMLEASSKFSKKRCDFSITSPGGCTVKFVWDYSIQLNVSLWDYVYVQEYRKYTYCSHNKWLIAERIVRLISVYCGKTGFLFLWDVFVGSFSFIVSEQ